jgi:hypothetical protein
VAAAILPRGQVGPLEGFARGALLVGVEDVQDHHPQLADGGLQAFRPQAQAFLPALAASGPVDVEPDPPELAQGMAGLICNARSSRMRVAARRM